jgi:hypothetical protein
MTETICLRILILEFDKSPAQQVLEKLGSQSRKCLVTK